MHVLCLRAECEASNSEPEECCAAAADDRCGQGSADPEPGNSCSGGGQRQIKGVWDIVGVWLILSLFIVTGYMGVVHVDYS